MQGRFLSFGPKRSELKGQGKLTGNRLVIPEFFTKKLLEIHEHRLALTVQGRIKLRVVTVLDLVPKCHHEFEILTFWCVFTAR